MKKVILGTLAAVLMLASVFAGDAAFFDDIGFSDDGKYYLFGQYGKQDKTYKAWAEIYTVDVAANDFVRNEIYKTKPSDVTSEISGKDAYEELKKKSTWKTSKYNAKPASVKTLLFLRESEKKLPTEEIVFKDFENSSAGNEVFYHVRLVPEFLIRKSRAAFPTSKLIRAFSPWYSPCAAKQYSQRRLHACATWRQIALMILPCFILPARRAKLSSENSLPASLRASMSAMHSLISPSSTSGRWLYFSSISATIWSAEVFSYMAMMS